MNRRRTTLWFFCEKCKKMTPVIYELGEIINPEEEKENNTKNITYVDIPEESMFLGQLFTGSGLISCEYCKSKEYTQYIDSIMVNAVEKFNGIGIETEYCCSGHYIGDFPYIVFKYTDFWSDKLSVLLSSLDTVIEKFPEFKKCDPSIELKINSDNKHSNIRLSCQIEEIDEAAINVKEKNFDHDKIVSAELKTCVNVCVIFTEWLDEIYRRINKD